MNKKVVIAIVGVGAAGAAWYYYQKKKAVAASAVNTTQMPAASAQVVQPSKAIAPSPSPGIVAPAQPAKSTTPTVAPVIQQSIPKAQVIAYAPSVSTPQIDYYKSHYQSATTVLNGGFLL